MAEGNRQLGPNRGGRKKGVPNKITGEKIKAQQEYFNNLVDDDYETKLWHEFLNGPDLPPIAQRDPDFSAIFRVRFSAFKLAVEYKRGMPVQPYSGEGGGPIKMVWDIPVGTRADAIAKTYNP
jgi:hypothetical protein